MPQPTIIKWEEPNREGTPPLHIADRGARYSSLTGATWLDEHQYLVAHRSGLRAAFFDTRRGSEPARIFELPHLSDDIASKKVAEDAWEVAVSGCWASVFSKFAFRTQPEPSLELLETKAHTERTFSHGVRYDAAGNLCVALHTGADPRIEIEGRVWRLPPPWGTRCVCHDSETNTYFAVAVSANPKLKEYKDTVTSIWSLGAGDDEWTMLFAIPGMHSDACAVYQQRIWLPDQKADRVVGACLKNERPPIVIKGGCFDFPHGLAISAGGKLAVTNYGSSSVVLVELDPVIRAHPGSRQTPK